jgi:hypothetical protein
MRFVRPRLSRRQLLVGAGAASLAPLAPLVPLTEAEAQAEAFPLRLICWFTPNGTIRDEWLPAGGESDFTFKKILAPLETYKQKLLILDGLKFEREGPGNDHMRGPHNMFAGSRLLDGSFTGGDMGKDSSGWGSHVSIDQHVATKLDPKTPFKSLVLGVTPKVNPNVRHRLSYAAENQPIAPEIDPYALYQNAFASLAGGTGAEALAKLERQRLERKSVIDLVSSELNGLSPQLGTNDRVKLEAHLQALRAIELRLENAGSDKECTVPGAPARLDPYANDDHPAIGRAMMDLLATSIACDMTRVSSFMWSGSTSDQRFTWLGIDEGHHTISHEPDDPGTAARQELIDINVWYAEQFAYFLGLLEGIPEGNGTALDNTLIVWGNELGRGNTHSNTEIPIIIAGGGSVLKTGRKLSYDKLQINRLLVSLCHLMGLDDQTFGNLDKGSGGLPGLT